MLRLTLARAVLGLRATNVRGFASSSAASVPVVLPHANTAHDSVTINVGNLTGEHATTSPTAFGAHLESSLASFRGAGKTAVWLKLPIAASDYIPVAAAQGFKFHNAEGDEATLALWIKEGVSSRIPPFATHQVGVGGLVLRGGDNDPYGSGRPLEALVVKEARHSYGVKFKLPGGLADLGEDFGEAACREVLEETGVTTVFEKLLTVRHQHGAQFGRSDIYATAQLRAVSEDIVLDNYELEFARWMCLKELRSQTDHAMLIQAIDVALGAGAVAMAETELASVVPGRRPYKLYHAALPVAEK